MTNREQVIRTIREHLAVEEDKIVPEANFMNDLGADSLDIVELVMAIEEQFHIEIPDNDAEKLTTVKDLIDYVDKVKAE